MISSHARGGRGLKISQYVHSHPDGQLEEDGAKTISDVDDIEGVISKELESMKSSSISHEKPFHSVKLDIACGMLDVVSQLSFSLITASTMQ